MVVALPLNQETKGLLDKEKLALMKPSALLINVGRGKVVDQEALANLLKNRHIRGAALDVTTPEPLPPDHE
ncbi:MAG: NAD(P)-dependent oxidoreductase, partial [Candidatus Izemoplasmatales bacterium]